MKVVDTFCSRNARDLFVIATTLCDFNAEELWMEIQALRSRRASSINQTTVENAMTAINKRVGCEDLRVEA